MHNTNVKSKKPALLLVLRYLSVFTAMFVLFPLLLGTETYFRAQTETATILYRFLLLELCGFFGYGVCALLGRLHEKRRLPTAVTVGLGILLLGVPVFGVYFGCGGNFESLRMIPMLAYAAIAYGIGILSARRPYGEINTTASLAWVCALHIVVIVTLTAVAFGYSHPTQTENTQEQTIGMELSDEEIHLLDKDVSPENFSCDFGLFIPEFLIYIAVHFLVRNQSHIDRLMERRKHKMEDLPRWVRSYNLWLTSAVMAVIAILFLCKDWMVVGIQWASTMLGRGITAVWLWFGSIFVHEGFQDFHVPEHSDNWEEVADVAVRGDHTTAMLLGYLLLAMLLAAGVWLIFRYHLIGKLWRALKGLLRQVKIGNSQDKELLEAEYTDSETELNRKEREWKRIKNQNAYKLWRQRYRQFLKIKDEKLRYELGFALLADYYKLRGVPLTAGDTAIQIGAKAVQGKKLEEEASCQMVDGYHRLCYAGSDCSIEQLSVLEEALRQAYTVSKSLKTVGI